MASFEHIDSLLGEALECIVSASNNIKQLVFPEQNQSRIILGRALAEIWEVRDIIYRVAPEIKYALVREYELNEESFNELIKIQNNAYVAEHNGAFHEASDYYKELFRKSNFGYFRLVAEAGLYRLSNTQQDERPKD